MAMRTFLARLPARIAAPAALCALVLCATSPWPAYAQFNTMGPVGIRSWNNPTSAFIEGMFNPPYYARYATRSVPQAAAPLRLAEPAGKAAEPALTGLDALRITATDFRPIGHRPVIGQFANLARTPAERAAVKDALTALQAEIEAAPAFRRNNVAYALALLIATCLETLSGTTLPEQLLAPMALDVNTALLSASKIRQASADQRRDLYDALLATTSIMLILAGPPPAAGQAGAPPGDDRKVAQAMARDTLTWLGFKLQ